MTEKQKAYAEYLQSPEWLDLRALAVERAMGRCQLCYSNKRIEVHHRRYVERGKEDLRDLTVLCHRCHYKFTFWIQKRANEKPQKRKKHKHKGHREWTNKDLRFERKVKEKHAEKQWAKLSGTPADKLFGL